MLGTDEQSGWLRRYVLLRRRQLLVGVRNRYRPAVAAIDAVAGLTDDDRRTMRAAVRAFALQQVAFTMSPWRHAHRGIRLVTGCACLVVSLWWLASALHRAVAVAPLAAIVTYLLGAAVLISAYSIWQAVGRSRYLVVCLALAAFASVVASLAPARYQSTLWHGTLVGLSATMVLAATMAGRLAIVSPLWRWVFYPRARGRAGWPLPPQLAAAHLLGIVQVMGEVRRLCRHPRVRGQLVRWIRRETGTLGWELPYFAQTLGFGTAVVADVRRRTRHLTVTLERWQVRLLNDDQLVEYDRVLAESTAATAALFRGDWSMVLLPEEPSDPERPGLRWARRVGPAALLVAVAVALPFLPERTAPVAVITNIQLGLITAAVLSLFTVDPAHRDQILSAVKDYSRPGH